MRAVAGNACELAGARLSKFPLDRCPRDNEEFAMAAPLGEHREVQSGFGNLVEI